MFPGAVLAASSSGKSLLDAGEATFGDARAPRMRWRLTSGGDGDDALSGARSRSKRLRLRLRVGDRVEGDDIASDVGEERPGGVGEWG